MPQLATTPPLTKLSEEEALFRDTVRDFAARAVKPRVAAMERAAAIDPAVLTQCFEIGLMGIETPEQHGGAGGSLLMTVLAVEIGRASCRERGWMWEVGGGVERKSEKEYGG